MAITRHLAEFVLAEHRLRKITGQVLLLGRQTVFMTPAQAEQLVERCGVALRPERRIEYDKMPYGREQQFISDVSFFSLFSDAQVVACDVSDAECADIIFSLSDDPPASMVGAYDFIYNGSVLDNVFDPAACARNISRMLKPDGVVFHYEGASHFNPAYLKFTPDWLFDYYAVNGFADFQGYLCLCSDVHAAPWRVFEWSAYHQANASLTLTMPMKYASDGMVVAVAQNSPASTLSETPIQNIYRQDQQKYQAAFARFASSPRRAALRQMVSSKTGKSEGATAIGGDHRAASWRDRLHRLASGTQLKSFVPIEFKKFAKRLLEGQSHSQSRSPQSPPAEVVTPGHVFLGTVG